MKSNDSLKGDVLKMIGLLEKKPVGTFKTTSELFAIFNRDSSGTMSNITRSCYRRDDMKLLKDFARALKSHNLHATQIETMIERLKRKKPQKVRSEPRPMSESIEKIIGILNRRKIGSFRTIGELMAALEYHPTTISNVIIHLCKTNDAKTLKTICVALEKHNLSSVQPRNALRKMRGGKPVVKTLMMFAQLPGEILFFEFDEDLSRFQHVFIGRDDKSIELRNELAEFIYGDEGKCKHKDIGVPSKDWDQFIKCGIYL